MPSKAISICPTVWSIYMTHIPWARYPFGVYLRPSVETALTKHADAAGIGQGMLQGQLANMVAVIKIIMPPIYLQSYKFGMARGIPGMPFFLYSLYFMLNAGLLLTVPVEQL